MSSAAPTRRRRLGRLERPALAGVLVREVINFSSYWRSTTFSSTVEPTIYLLAFGFGFGSLVSDRRRATTTSSSSARAPSRRRCCSRPRSPRCSGPSSSTEFQRTYDAILAAPVDTEELVTAETLWIAIRAGTYGCIPMLVAIVFGLEPSWGMLTVPAIAFVAGFGWAGFGIVDRRGDEVDRELQLRHQRGAHAAVPRRRDVLPDRRAAGAGRRRSPSSTRSTTASSSSATPSSAGTARATSSTSAS